MIFENIQAGRNSETAGKLSFRSQQIDTQSLQPTQVIVRNEITSLNYKDRLVWGGLKGFDRGGFSPLGFDGVGVVVWAGASSEIETGSKVMFFSEDTKLSLEAGLQRFSVHESENLIRLSNVSSMEAISMGVPGFTALGVLVMALQQDPAPRRILITGTSGSVGKITTYLFKDNFESIHEVNIPRQLIGDKPINAPIFQMPDADLMPARWEFIVDTLGGQLLAAASRFLAPKGTIVSLGNTLGGQSQLPLAPLYSRGVSIQGFNLLLAIKDNQLIRAQMLEKLEKYPADKIIQIEVLGKRSLEKYLDGGTWDSGIRRLIYVDDLV
jgi:acrylyl-CoA reductase (NADPH)